MSPTYRAPMRSRDDSVPESAGAERGLRHGVCGVGGRLHDPPADLAEALVAVQREHDERVAARLRRFAEVPDGAVVWTRDSRGAFHRGVLTGPWTYDARGVDVDLCHVRPTTWVEVAEADVPAAVRASFARGGRNFQRVRAL